MRSSRSAFPIKGKPSWPGTGRRVKPVAPCIVWQCRRSAEICQALRRKGLEEYIRTKTGLQVDPLFPSSKIQWLLENRPDIRKLAEEGKLCLGTVDAWLVWNLTGGKRFVTDFSNASRTQLFNIGQGAWDPDLLTLFGVPASALPEVVASNELLGDAILLAENRFRSAAFWAIPTPRCWVTGCSTNGQGEGHLRHWFIAHDPLRRSGRRRKGYLDHHRLEV